MIIKLIVTVSMNIGGPTAASHSGPTNHKISEYKHNTDNGYS